MNVRFERLEGILPVAQTQRLGEMEFTMLAIECYTAGFVTTFLIEHDWQLPDSPPDDDPDLPSSLTGLLIITEAVDDRGNHYVGHIRGASGGGGPDGLLRDHAVYCFAPALDPNAPSLTLAMLQVEQPRYDSSGRPKWMDHEVVAGPWTITVSLVAPSL